MDANHPKRPRHQGRDKNRPQRPRHDHGAGSGRLPAHRSRGAETGRPTKPGRQPQPPRGLRPVNPAGNVCGAGTTRPQTHWGDVAEWYDQLVGQEGSEYHQKVVHPGVLRLIEPRPGEPVLDVACGQGALCRLLAERRAEVTGVDAAEPLVRAARERGPAEVRYHVADARELASMPSLAAGHFAAASCVLAIQNIHPIPPVFQEVARLLRRGGRFVLVMMHPCFRGPKETSWAWDPAKEVQYRRVDRYLLPRKTPIVTHPGSAPGEYTWTFHRPIEAYAKALRNAGLLIDAIEEWPSHKSSQPGPRAAAENAARNEIPMFMAVRAVKVGGGGT